MFLQMGQTFPLSLIFIIILMLVAHTITCLLNNYLGFAYQLDNFLSKPPSQKVKSVGLLADI